MGVMAVGAATSTQMIRLVQQAAAPVELHTIALVGEGFVLRHDCPRLLPSLATCSVVPTSSTASVGHQSAAVRVESSGGMRLVGVSASIQSGAVGVLETEPAGPVLDFGTHVVGSVAFRDIALINRGTAAVEVEAASVTGPQAMHYRVDDFCAERGPIEPGARCLVRITWSSTDTGSSLAAVHWRSNGQSAPPLHLHAAASPNHRRRVLPPVQGRAVF